MMPSEQIKSVRTHVRYLEYAIATTSCPATQDVLRQMLEKAETSLVGDTQDSTEARPRRFEA